jgi:hypothetical protein
MALSDAGRRSSQSAFWGRGQYNRRNPNRGSRAISISATLTPPARAAEPVGVERGPCYGLCLGSVTYSLSTPSGPTLIDDRSSMVIQDKGAEVMPLSAPVRG